MVTSLEAETDEPGVEDTEPVIEIDPCVLSSMTTSLGSYCRRWEIVRWGMRISWS